MGKNTLGIVALIFGIIGLFTCGCGGILAIIFGAIGLSQDEEPGLAKAGLILGIISLIIGILLLVFLWQWVMYFIGMGEIPTNGGIPGGTPFF